MKGKRNFPLKAMCTNASLWGSWSQSFEKFEQNIHGKQFQYSECSEYILAKKLRLAYWWVVVDNGTWGKTWILHFIAMLYYYSESHENRECLLGNGLSFGLNFNLFAYWLLYIEMRTKRRNQQGNFMVRLYRVIEKGFLYCLKGI